MQRGSSADVVFLIGRECSGAEAIASDLSTNDIRTSWTPWDEFPSNGTGACILLSPPEDQQSRGLLASLVQRGIPLFYLNDHPVYRLYGRDRIVPLPCRFDASSLRIFLSWIGSPAAGASTASPGRRARSTARRLRATSRAVRAGARAPRRAW